VIDVLVKPFKIDKLDTKTYYLVILLENKAVSNQEVMASISETDPTSATRISELQRELKETKENLQATVEEVETSNEELQATNEELLAANEELQSTNEELQSVNEEMHTVNAEHQSKIQELAALNADMDNLLKSTDIGTIFLDKELKIRWFTPAIKEQFNLLMADVGRPIANFSSNIKGMNIISEVEYVISTGKQVEKETYVEDGKKWFLSRVLPYQDGNYRIQGAVITFVDITQIKQVQLELELNESLFRALFETSPAAVITTDMDGVVETANQNAARLLSTEVSEVKGRDIFELFNASSRGKIKNLYKEKNATKVLRSTDEIFIKGRGGKEIPVSLITEQLEHKNKSLLLLNITDISEQLKSQKELQSLNEKLALKVEATTKEVGEKDLLLQHVLESTTAGYWIFDQGEGLIMSESFHSVFREEGDLVSSWDVWKDIMVEEDYEDFEAKYNAHVKSKGKTPFEVSCRMYRTDGNPLWIYIKGKVIEWQEKKPQKVVGSLVNISQLKNAQLELSNTNTKLERSLQELSLKNHELEQIAYVATHDLRAPVLNLSHLLKMFDTDQVEGKNQEVFEKIHSSVNQLNGTLNDLINIAAINNEEIPDRFKRVNLEKEFNTVLDSVDLLSKESQINISSVFKAKMLTYYPVHIKSIFQNLLTNAIKYRKKDSPLQVDVKTYESGNYTVIEITDNGIGIDLNKQGKKLFGMFKQLHAGYEGKGLGLYLVKTQVELLGGEIEVESEPGKGTTFKICLLDQKKFQKTRGAN
ncbi:MAG: PAS domain-containing protein, partial [Luteibaculum sp.]